MKNLFLICNAHIDPVWQWNEEEGIQAAIATFASAANLAEEFNYIFCHNEALLYSWIEQYAPDLFQKIQRLIKQGKWRIMGGWYLQPDCNIPCGESLVRQILAGKRYFKEKFGAEPCVAVNFDSFGHSIGLPQILKKTGYRAYICCRPSAAESGIMEDDFTWVGPDGSEIEVKRDSGQYNSSLGHAVDKIKGHLNAYRSMETDGFVLWGVGNHGGGPSRKDLQDIEQLIREERVHIFHSYPEEYFERGARKSLRRVFSSLNRSMPGCYTSQIELKLKYRKLENSYYFAEKICASADMLGLFDYPFEKLKRAEEKLLLSQFHDILPGTTVESAYQKALNAIAHGQDMIDEIIFSAFNSYLARAKRTREGTYPVYVFNPSPYERKETFACEFMLADQNWTETETVFTAENALCQVVKEESNVPIDWRKKVLLQTTLRPMTLNAFELIPHTINMEEKTVKNAAGYALQTENYSFLLTESGNVCIRFSSGRAIHGVAVCVYKDLQDTWIMQGELLNGFKSQKGIFRLATAEECREFLDGTELPMRLIERGAVCDEIEILYVYNHSCAVVTYILNKQSNCIDVKIRLIWQERQCAVKLVINTDTSGEFMVQTAYGEEKFEKDGKEYPMQKYCTLAGKNDLLALFNNGVYASSCTENYLAVTLARGACFCAHPIGDKPIVRADRYNKCVDAGEHVYQFRIASLENRLALQNLARDFNETPYVISAFGRGESQSFENAVTIEGNIELSSMRKSEKGKYVLRLFNNTAETIRAKVCVPPLQVEKTISFKPYEIITLLVVKNIATITENII